MSAYTDAIDAARNGGSVLHRQVIYAIAKAAQDIAAEPENTPNHQNRKAWADRIRLGGLPVATDYANRLILVVLENPTVAAAPETSPDGDIQFVVNSVIGQFISL